MHRFQIGHPCPKTLHAKRFFMSKTTEWKYWKITVHTFHDKIKEAACFCKERSYAQSTYVEFENFEGTNTFVYVDY